ncbi:hypothetical protein [Halalkalicoccus salilacus]|uniref:hypothetical protein n=1 Tax=Halalkalicoccus sp. GCM10025704 TaxID=3252662 RepID=UPI00360CAFE5
MNAIDDRRQRIVPRADAIDRWLDRDAVERAARVEVTAPSYAENRSSRNRGCIDRTEW